MQCKEWKSLFIGHQNTSDKKEKLLKTSDEEVKKKVNEFEKSNKLKHDEMVKVFELKIKERKNYFHFQNLTKNGKTVWII